MAWYNPLSWFKGKDPRHNHEFNDGDRSAAADITNQKARLKKLEMQKEHEIKMMELEARELELEQELADLQGDDEEFDEEDSADALLVKLLQPILQRAHSVSPSSHAAGLPASPSPAQTMTDDQLRKIFEDLPVHLKSAARVSSDDRIQEAILNQYPGVDQDTLERAVKIVREN